jgi:hypothetical protein
MQSVAENELTTTAGNSSPIDHIVSNMLSGQAPEPCTLPPYKKQSLLQRLRERDRPIIACGEAAHGPG